MNKRCIDYNSIQVKELSDELGLKPIIVAAKIAVWQDKNNTYDIPSANDLVEGISKQKNSMTGFVRELNNLPKPIVDSIKLVEDVPLEIIGNNTIYYAMKDVFESNGITDPLLINWAGLNKHLIGHPKNIKSEKELRLLVLQSLNNKSDKRKYKEEFKINKLAEENFNNWLKALDSFPLEFQDIMLAHAIKHIINPERKSKYVLQLSSVALTNTYGIMMNKPNEMNRLGKLYDQEVIKSTGDAVGHEKSASGKGYWVHIPKSSKNSEQYKINVDLLRKLSPSTWCTASSMTEHYVQYYDNYLLIVDGVTVVGIEASELGSNGKIQVKEVTSRNNNGIASIDYLEDTIAFFEKHNLDTNNDSLKKAIMNKEMGSSDEDVIDWENERERELNRNIDRFNGEYEYEPEDYNGYEPGYDIEELIISIANMTTIDEAKEGFENNPFLFLYFNYLSQDFRNNRELANKAIDYDAHNIVHVSTTVPFYNELVIKAVNKTPMVFNYLNEESKNLPGLRQIFNTYSEETKRIDIELPFSKSSGLIQGYYNPKTDEVIVVTSNTPIKEVSKVAIHEVAHRGMLRMAKDLGGFEQLYSVLTSAEKQLMEKIPELLKRTGHKSLDSLLLDYGFNKNTKEGKFKLLQELAARWAETLVDKPKPSWWKELLQEIGKWIKRFTNKTLNEQEVNELVGGFVKYGTKKILNSNEKTTSNQTEITIGNKKYKQGTYSFKEIFENIGDKSYANKLLKMLYGLSNQNIDDMKVEIVDNIVEAGHFDNGIVRININAANPDIVFTHEIIHALTALKLAYWKKNSPKVYKDMEKVWIDSKAILDPLNERYEFSSLDEFYAALSKQSFVEELATIKDDSFIGKLIQLFKNMLSKLGIKVEGTLAERALNNLSEVISLPQIEDENYDIKLNSIDNEQKTYYQNNSEQSNEDFIASEKTIRDLAARLANRIGIEVKFISDRSQNFKGKLEGNIATINLAYATLDSPLHEIAFHPIIAALKQKSETSVKNHIQDLIEKGVIIKEC